MQKELSNRVYKNLRKAMKRDRKARIRLAKRIRDMKIRAHAGEQKVCMTESMRLPQTLFARIVQNEKKKFQAALKLLHVSGYVFRKKIEKRIQAVLMEVILEPMGNRSKKTREVRHAGIVKYRCSRCGRVKLKSNYYRNQRMCKTCKRKLRMKLMRKRNNSKNT
jgi:hypothetical protein